MFTLNYSKLKKCWNRTFLVCQQLWVQHHLWQIEFLKFWLQEEIHPRFQLLLELQLRICCPDAKFYSPLKRENFTVFLSNIQIKIIWKKIFSCGVIILYDTFPFLKHYLVGPGDSNMKCIIDWLLARWVRNEDGRFC